jgi:hypothetical protein
LHLEPLEAPANQTLQMYRWALRTWAAQTFLTGEVVERRTIVVPLRPFEPVASGGCLA